LKSILGGIYGAAILDKFGMRKLPHTPAEDLLEIVMSRYERFGTLPTSNCPVEDWGKLLVNVDAMRPLFRPRRQVLFRATTCVPSLERLLDHHASWSASAT